MGNREKNVFFSKIKDRRVEKIIGLPFQEKKILENKDKYIYNAILFGSAEILKYTVSKIREFDEEYYVKDEEVAKDMLLKILQIGNNELLEVFLKEVVDRRIDIVNENLRKERNMYGVPLRIKYMDPLTMVLTNKFLNMEETEDLAISLIDNGANIKSSAIKTKTPLDLAIDGLYPRVVKKLIDYGVKVPDIIKNKEIMKKIDRIFSISRKPKINANLIKKYITEGQVDSYLANLIDEKFIDKIKANKEFVNIIKDMLLNKNIKKKHELAIGRILKSCADDIQIDKHLVDKKDKEDIEFIIKKMNTTKNVDELKSIIIDTIPDYFYKEETLINEVLAEKNSKDYLEQILVLSAIKTRDIEILRKILNKTKNVNIDIKVKKREEVFAGLFNKMRMTKFDKVTPLILVLSEYNILDEDKEKIAFMLIKEFNADIGITNKEYAKTIIDLALKKKMYNVATEVFEKTSAILDISNNKFNYMVSKNTITKKEEGKIKDIQFDMHLEERFTQEQIKEIKSNKELDKFFTKLANREFDSFKSDIDEVDIKKFGGYMFERAIVSKDLSNIKMVLDKGVDINFPLKVNNDIDYQDISENGTIEVTPIMFAISAKTLDDKEKENIIGFLLQNGADIEKTYDAQGMSAIQQASCNKLKNVVKDFIERGANLNSMDESGRTSIGYARRCLTEYEKEKVLKMNLEKREQKMNQDLEKVINESLDSVNVDSKDFISKLLDIRMESMTKINDLRLLSHLYSMSGEQKVDGVLVDLEGWDGGGHPIMYRIDILIRIARDIKYNNYGNNIAIEKENLLDIIKAEILNEFYVINGTLNVKDSVILDGINLKKHNKTITKFYVDKIKGLKKNETFSMHAATRGHSIYMVFERMENGLIQVTRYNLGQGARFHDISNDNRVKPYKVEMPQEEKGLEVFIKNILEWREIDIETRCDKYKEEMIDFIKENGGKRIIDGIAMKIQSVGNCSIKNDTAARVGRILQRLKVQNKDLLLKINSVTEVLKEEEKLRDLAKNICRFIKNYERVYARDIVKKDNVLTSREMNEKIDETVIKRYSKILDEFQNLEYYSKEELNDMEEEIYGMKKEMIDFLKKRSMIDIDEKILYDKEHVDRNIVELIENLNTKIEYINKIKNNSINVYMMLKRDVLAKEHNIPEEEVTIDMW